MASFRTGLGASHSDARGAPRRRSCSISQIAHIRRRADNVARRSGATTAEVASAVAFDCPTLAGRALNRIPSAPSGALGTAAPRILRPLTRLRCVLVLAPTEATSRGGVAQRRASARDATIPRERCTAPRILNRPRRCAQCIHSRRAGSARSVQHASRGNCGRGSRGGSCGATSAREVTGAARRPWPGRRNRSLPCRGARSRRACHRTRAAPIGHRGRRGRVPATSCATAGLLEGYPKAAAVTEGANGRCLAAT
mmetsp:Transcript_94674/g.267257  ORF Transcript_94674/g.267257 Transcript_94674/m.267257 type:complete len:254 (+) Transcript_94674:1200-1961(+)